MRVIVLDLIMSEIHNVNGCYACCEVKENMIRLCNNDLCNGRICKTCLPEQLQQKIFTCGLCRQGIVVQNKFNWNEFCKAFGNLFITLMIIVVGSGIAVINALGTTIMGADMNCANRRRCGGDYGWVIPFTLSLCIFFWPGRLWSCCMNYPSKKRCNYNCVLGCMGNLGCVDDNYIPGLRWPLMNAIIFVIVNAIILVSHIFGGVTFWVLYGQVEPYTWRSCFAGYLCWLTLIGIGMIGWILFCIGKCIKNKYSRDEYGIIMDERIVFDERTHLYTQE